MPVNSVPHCFNIMHNVAMYTAAACIVSSPAGVFFLSNLHESFSPNASLGTQEQAKFALRIVRRGCRCGLEGFVCSLIGNYQYNICDIFYQISNFSNFELILKLLCPIDA